jgi:hypothetical protein
MERKQSLVKSCESDARAASTAIATNENLAAVDHLSNSQRTAEVRLTTSRNMLAKSKTALNLTASELETARRAVDQVAKEIAELRAREELPKRFAQALEEISQVSADIIAAWTVLGRNAVTPPQCQAVNRMTFSLAELQVESPQLHMSVTDLRNDPAQQPFEAEGRLQAQRERIRQAQRDLRTRLERIASGKDDGAAAT